MLGSGWYRDYLAWADSRDHYGKDIALLLQLDITYTDGSVEQLVSDGTWKTQIGGILNAEIYDGETYDTTRELPGWDLPGYDDSEWNAVAEQDYNKSNLIPTENELVRAHEVFIPIEILTTPEGDTVVDFGQNLVGWVQLNVGGAKGQKVTLQHAEVLTKEGNFYTENLRAADQKATYVLDGSDLQVLTPHFTFYGFRYVKVEGIMPTKDNMTAITLYSDMESTGSFVSSNPLLNQLQHNIQWGQRGNFVDVPTDCPQRDERLGWTGDAQAFFRTAAYNRNVNAFFSKWLKDLAADQLETGAVPFVIPNVLGANAAASAGWADVATIIPWESYLLFGDRELLETQYPSMKSWVSYMQAASTDNLWNTGFHFGDWLFYRPHDDNDGRSAVTDKYLIAQCFYAYSTQLLINAAKALGKTDEAATYESLLADIKAAFQREYITPSGRLVSSTQTAYVLALHFDMLPEALRAQAAERLVENIKSYAYHLTTGFLGTPYLSHVLSRFGYDEVAYRLLMQESYPSWLYPVTQGATTIWERWDGIKPDGSFQVPSMNSYNHYAYGAIGDWMYQHIAGIQALESGPGYRHFRIKPVPGGKLQHAAGKLDTYYGEILSSWKFEGEKFMLEVHVPVNTTAEVILPFGEFESILEGKKSLDKAKGIQKMESPDRKVWLQLGSGNYNFEIPVPQNQLPGAPVFEGTYQFSGSFSFQMEVQQLEDGNLSLSAMGNSGEYAPSDSDPLQFELLSGAKNIVRFETNADGAIVGLHLNYDGENLSGQKL
jgi:alpha-L-rhamnosidase